MSKLKQLQAEYKNISNKKQNELKCFLNKVISTKPDLIEKIKIENCIDDSYISKADIIECLKRIYSTLSNEELVNHGFEPFVSEFQNQLDLADKNIRDYIRTNEGKKEILIQSILMRISIVMNQNEILGGRDNITYIELEDNNTTLIIYCHIPEKIIGYGNSLIELIKEDLSLYHKYIKSIKIKKHTKYEYEL